MKNVQDAWARYMVRLHAGYIGDVTQMPSGQNDLIGSVNAAITDANNAATDASNALTLANNAQSTANGRNTIMYAGTAPTAHPDGSALVTDDLWYKTSSGNIIGVYQWSGSAWVALPIANDAIFANIDAGKVTTGTLSSINIVGNYIGTQANVGTGASPNVIPGVLINSSGDFACYANTGPVLSFNASSGSLTLLGTLSVTGNINLGGSGRFYSNSSGARVEIDSTSGYDSIAFVTAGGSYNYIGNRGGNAVAINTATGALVQVGTVTTYGEALALSSNTDLVCNGNAYILTTPLNVNADSTGHRGIVITAVAGTTSKYLDCVVSGSSVAYVDSAGGVHGTGAYQTISDSRTKQNITYPKCPDALARVMQLRPAMFQYKGAPDLDRFGLIAQDVQKAIPEAVRDAEHFDDEGNQTGSLLEIDSGAIDNYLILGIQALAARVEKLEAK